MPGAGRGRGDARAGLLAPLAAFAVLVTALVQSLLDRRRPSGTAVPDADAAPAPGEGAAPRSGLKARIAQRVPALRVPIAVLDRYGDLNGNNLAAAITFQAFVSLLPLLLVVVAVAGFLSHNGVDVAGSIIRNLGLDGDAAAAVGDAVATARENRRATSVVGLVALLWSGLGLVQGLQFAFNQVWQVEAEGAKDKAKGLGWLVGAALLFVLAAAVTTVLRWLPGFLAPLGAVVSLAVSFLLWLWTSTVLPNHGRTWRSLVPGAVLGAIGLEVLKVVGAYYVPRAVASSSQLYGSLGLVLAILGWLLFFGRLVVYSACLNVVLHERRAGTERVVVDLPQLEGRPPMATRAGRRPKEHAG